MILYDTNIDLMLYITLNNNVPNHNRKHININNIGFLNNQPIYL